MLSPTPIRLAAPAAPPPPPLPPEWRSPPILRGPDDVLYVFPSLRGPGLARCRTVEAVGIEVCA